MTAMKKNITGPATMMSRFRHDDSGAIAVIVAVAMVALMGVSALVVDAGSLYSERRTLQTAADAAALAGAQELPADPVRARDVALAYLAANAPEAEGATVTIESGLAVNDTVRIEVGVPDSPLYFARIWGDETAPVAAGASARVTSPLGYGHGVMPFGVMAKFSEDPETAYGYGWEPPAVVELKTVSNKVTGNFDLLSLSDPPGESWGTNSTSNPDSVRGSIANGGTDHAVQVGSEYKTATGNKAAIIDALETWIGGDTHTFADVLTTVDENGVRHTTVNGETGRCHRLVICPIVANPEGTGAGRYEWPAGSKKMVVIGFVEFFITEWGTQGNDCWIKGIPVRTVSTDELVGGAVGSSGQVHYSLVQ